MPALFIGRLLLERLQKYQQELNALTEPEDGQTVTTNEPEAATTEQEQAPQDESALPIDLEAVRRQATADAIEEGRRRAGFNQQPQSYAEGYNAEVQRLTGAFQARFADL